MTPNQPAADLSAALADAENAISESNDLVLAAFALFEDGKSTFVMESGKVCEIYPATMKTMAPIMAFFRQIANALDTGQMATLIDLIADEQRRLIAEGQDPSKIDLKKIASSELVIKAFGNVSLISLLFEATFETLPDFAALFSNVTPEEYGDLKPDEGVLIAMGIFIVNYSFFTQRLLPIFLGFIRSVVGENKKARARDEKAAKKASQ